MKRSRVIFASQEGGNPLTDSPAVQLFCRCWRWPIIRGTPWPDSTSPIRRWGRKLGWRT